MFSMIDSAAAVYYSPTLLQSSPVPGHEWLEGGQETIAYSRG